MTRDGLANGALVAIARAQASPEWPMLTDAELDRSMRATLNEIGTVGDLWVFGYGSLIWNPAIRFLERRPARLWGWRRRFCLASTGRGTRDAPGAMLALDRGGSCLGVAFRIAAAHLEEELRLLWRREMVNGAYDARCVTARIGMDCIDMLTFTANRRHPRFIGTLDETDIVDRIAFARGPLGSCHDYLRRTMAALSEAGLRDVGLDRLCARVEARLAAADAR